MWKPQRMLKGIDPITGSAGAAALSTVLTQHIASRYVKSELSSEILCWLLLPLLFQLARPRDIGRFGTIPKPQPQSKSRPISSRFLWIAAASIAIASCYKAEIGVIGLLPALTPLLLIAEKALRFEWQTSRNHDSHTLFPLVHTVWGTTLVASFAVLTLSNWKLNIQGLAVSVILIAALLLLYIILTPSTTMGTRSLGVVDIEEAIIPLSQRAVVILVVAMAIQAVVFGSPSNKVLPTLLLGLAKASSWYFTTRTVCGSLQYQGTSRMIVNSPTSWLIATTMATFGIMSTRDPFMQSSETQALTHVVGSFLALSQIIHILPKQAKAKSILWSLALISLVPYLANVHAIAQSSASSTFTHPQEHPIEVLIRNAKADFKGMLRRQSQSYTAAFDEYQRRYNREPPDGFENWYNFASSHNSPLIDEFDIIFDTISPFWGLSGNEFIRAMNDVQNAPRSDLWRCSFSGGGAETRCRHPYRSFDRHIGLSFKKLLGDLSVRLPPLDFLVNHLDEPRVLIPPASSNGGISRGTARPKITDMSRRPTWDIITSFCASQQNHTIPQTKNTVETFALPFVTDLSSTMDLCRHPEYSGMHGIVMSPTSFYPIEGLVPILSTGSLSTMGDLLFPSPAYMESEFRYDGASDIKWGKKKNNLYWAGSTTGAFALDAGWQNYQRQRFVKLAQNLEREQHYYLREIGGVVGRVKSSFLNSRLFDVAFTRIFQCARKACREQRAYFNVKSWAGKDEALRSRLVFDIDGNGISGRYYKLLASNSVPLKQTLLREWHDDRLMPWVHYIPVSQSMEELPELIFYFTSTEAGQQRAREIADQGRNWFSKAFRDVDMSIYVYRLLLELARLQDQGRQAS